LECGGSVSPRQRTISPEFKTMMWVLMLLTGLAAFAALFGFVFACERL
jgi:ABC-type transporter Mla maintaining outer membrane lipid asymmetry permease subunit MlaE